MTNFGLDGHRFIPVPFGKPKHICANCDMSVALVVTKGQITGRTYVLLGFTPGEYSCTKEARNGK